MIEEKFVTAMIMAAGSGKRFGGDIPKQYLKINNEYILEITARKFLACEKVDDLIIVVSKDYEEKAKQIISGLNPEKTVTFVIGGKERSDSVRKGLLKVKDGIVLIHDAARPFVTDELINRVIEETCRTGTAIPVVDVKDTIRTDTGTLDRSKLHAVQTPQGFKTEILKRAYEKGYEEEFIGTDEASYVERTGIMPNLVVGEIKNTKITTKEDLPMENFNGPVLFGQGFDVHKLVEGRKCVLCGVDIPYERGLLGHSDADVALHALMDAILGAAGLGDIGKHFPDTDPKYEGISSMKLLAQVKSLIDDMGLEVGNCDVTIVCEQPKILPYVEEMRCNICEVLGIPLTRVNVKGTTTEKLGFTGRKEGIAAMAVASLISK